MKFSKKKIIVFWEIIFLVRWLSMLFVFFFFLGDCSKNIIKRGKSIQSQNKWISLTEKSNFSREKEHLQKKKNLFIEKVRVLLENRKKVTHWNWKYEYSYSIHISREKCLQQKILSCKKYLFLVSITVDQSCM